MFATFWFYFFEEGCHDGLGGYVESKGVKGLAIDDGVDL